MEDQMVCKVLSKMTRFEEFFIKVMVIRLPLASLCG